MLNARWRCLIGSLLSVVCALFVYGYATSGWNLDYSSTSPEGKYRVDVYMANRWQWATHIGQFEEPGFARLSRTADNQLIDTSGVITLMDSRVTWQSDKVAVGTQTLHDLPAGRWR